MTTTTSPTAGPADTASLFADYLLSLIEIDASENAPAHIDAIGWTATSLSLELPDGSTVRITVEVEPDDDHAVIEDDEETALATQIQEAMLAFQQSDEGWRDPAMFIAEWLVSHRR
jgi:hypothetical protein